MPAWQDCSIGDARSGAQYPSGATLVSVSVGPDDLPDPDRVSPLDVPSDPDHVCRRGDPTYRRAFDHDLDHPSGHASAADDADPGHSRCRHQVPRFRE
jgi:hypothetical protein